MSKQAKRRQHRQPARRPQVAQSFTPVAVRPRHDGWTSEKQVAFVGALAATACIEEACRAVGMTPRSFYDLRARADAGSFRTAVEAALDIGTHRIADAMLGRALHGEVTPIFYKGEQVGERRRYDNRLGILICAIGSRTDTASGARACSNIARTRTARPRSTPGPCAGWPRMRRPTRSARSAPVAPRFRSHSGEAGSRATRRRRRWRSRPRNWSGWSGSRPSTGTIPIPPMTYREVPEVPGQMGPSCGVAPHGGSA